MSGARSTAEVAEELGVSREKVRNWIKAGKLPAINIGTRTKPSFRILAEDLETFVAGLQVQAAPRTRRKKSKPAAIPFYEQ